MLTQEFQYLDELELALLPPGEHEAHVESYFEWLNSNQRPSRLYTDVLRRYCQHRWDETNHCYICVASYVDESNP